MAIDKTVFFDDDVVVVQFALADEMVTEVFQEKNDEDRLAEERNQ